MNISKLFEMQRKLDARIVKDKGLDGIERLPYLIHDLRAEMGELSNEWRGFKFWSNDRKPRTEVQIPCKKCEGTGLMGTEFDLEDCDECGGIGVIKTNPLIEEYVDCLHFLLSIGLTLGFDKDFKPHLVKVEEPLIMFANVYNITTDFQRAGGRTSKNFFYDALFSSFLGLGKSLSFTWDQIEQEYMEKNRVNHERQASGY